MPGRHSAELLSPAGGFESALAAFGAGADAVYCGLSAFSARAFADNLAAGRLEELLRVAKASGRKVYVAFNTLIEEPQTSKAIRLLADLDSLAPDGLIVQDLGVAAVCRRNFPHLRLHASTQMAVHNLEGVAALSRLGFARAVLARELTLEEVSYIAKRRGAMELECFIHGALCHSISGLCLFSAMEKGRSGNKGVCAYCCRREFETSAGRTLRPFSMKDLRLGEDARRLAEAGVASLKIEGRMKSPLYVAAATSYYRAILDGKPGETPPDDTAIVFSRRTTKLHLDGIDDSAVDPGPPGHLGSPAGVVKRVAKDREGRAWLRFRTLRALERRDGLQFDIAGGKTRPGFSISAMRTALSRSNVFEVPAGTDVEILLPDPASAPWQAQLREGDTVYCAMSNAVKRAFPLPSYRPSDWPGRFAVDFRVSLSPTLATAEASCPALGIEAKAEAPGAFEPAKDPGNATTTAKKAFSELGQGDFAPGDFTLSNHSGLFAPASVFKDLRRRLVAALQERRTAARDAKAEKALADHAAIAEKAAERYDTRSSHPAKIIKLLPGAKIPAGDWDETVLAISCDTDPAAVAAATENAGGPGKTRLALPVFTTDPAFGKMRVLVRRLVRDGFAKWEAADLATLSLLKACGAEDITADWSLYAPNVEALALLSSLGVRRFVASPENTPANVRALAESGFDIEFLAQQSTPLFISRTRPAETSLKDLAVFRRDGLWIATRRAPRLFETPEGITRRYDLSWSPPPC